MVSRIGSARLLAALVLWGVLAGGAAGQGSAPVATLADGRAGRIQFESQTPAGYFALARRVAAPKVVVFGTLRLPREGSGRVPAMVIAHGSAGVDAREAAWADRLTALEPFRRAVIADDRRFAAHVALYPYCSDWYTAERVTDHLTVKLRGTGEDITASASRYGRDCLARGATIGGDGEAKRGAPEAVSAFLRRVFGL